jgi:amphi-Trp domain-containing protein
MSDVNVSRTETLTRQQAADMLSALATALSEGAGVEVQLGASTLRVHVPDQVRYEVEVEVDGDEVELEVELTWSTATQARVTEPAAAAKPATAAKPAAATEPDPGSPRTRTAKNVAAARSRRSDGRA